MILKPLANIHRKSHNAVNRCISIRYTYDNQSRTHRREIGDNNGFCVNRVKWHLTQLFNVLLE